MKSGTAKEKKAYAKQQDAMADKQFIGMGNRYFRAKVGNQESPKAGRTKRSNEIDRKVVAGGFFAGQSRKAGTRKAKAAPAAPPARATPSKAKGKIKPRA